VRFVVVGAGAIGGVLVGRLAEHGHDVVLVARGAHLVAIRERGLTIESPDGSVIVAVPATASVTEAGVRPGDAIVVATKSQDTLGVLDELEAVAPAATPVVCAQNGVENERAALRRFSEVYGICVMCPATHLEPGVVQASSTPVTGIMDVGRWPDGVDAVTEEVAAALTASTFRSVARGDIARWKWGKLLLNLGNAVEAVFAPDPATRELVARARAEGVACLRAAGIDFVERDEDDARRGDLLSVHPIAGQRRGGGSTWQSLTRGSGTVETDYLTGEVVLLGRLHGVPTPVNALLQALANELARRREPPGSRSAAEVLASIDRAA
jgi:2-dehydropantoate 2-reductase